MVGIRLVESQAINGRSMFTCLPLTSEAMLFSGDTLVLLHYSTLQLVL